MTDTKPQVGAITFSDPTLLSWSELLDEHATLSVMFGSLHSARVVGLSTQYALARKDVHDEINRRIRNVEAAMPAEVTYVIRDCLNGGLD